MQRLEWLTSENGAFSMDEGGDRILLEVIEEKSRPAILDSKQIEKSESNFTCCDSEG